MVKCSLCEARAVLDGLCADCTYEIYLLDEEVLL